MTTSYLTSALTIVLALAAYCPCCKGQDEARVRSTRTAFTTSDPALQKLYDKAVAQAARNIKHMGKRKVMVEAPNYYGLYLETQPMAGYMYAKHDLEVARNNIEIFIDNQRETGRLPGAVMSYRNPHFLCLQGLCLPMPAYELYFWLGKDKVFLKKVSNALERYDAYLWKTRDSNNNGCLEAWCVGDTGEDGSARFPHAPHGWGFDHAPTMDKILKLTDKERAEHWVYSENGKNRAIPKAELTIPNESMDVMSYSYTCRDVLAKMSRELANGKETYWRNKADAVRAKIKSYLWVPEKRACYDYDKNGKRVDVLSHNNLRCMYYGSFDQDMADAFIRDHLMNPKEFYTPMPLVSIAANDPDFRNIPHNNWSGQPQGLTYQRSIRALENYGHYAELTLIGEKLLKEVGAAQKFTQQFCPLKGTVNTNGPGAYGPTLLASMEFVSRFYGIHYTQDKLYWSALNRATGHSYSLQIGDRVFEMTSRSGTVACSINGEKKFSFDAGIRVVSDVSGNIIHLIGIDHKTVTSTISYGGRAHKHLLKPNSVYDYNEPTRQFREGLSRGFYPVSGKEG